MAAIAVGEAVRDRTDFAESAAVTRDSKRSVYDGNRAVRMKGYGPVLWVGLKVKPDALAPDDIVSRSGAGSVCADAVGTGSCAVAEGAHIAESSAFSPRKESAPPIFREEEYARGTSHQFRGSVEVLMATHVAPL